MKSRKRLARDITNIFATQSGLFMMSLTFGHKLTLLTVMLSGCQTSIFNRRDYKSTEKTLSIVLYLCSICVDRAGSASLNIQKKQMVKKNVHINGAKQNKERMFDMDGRVRRSSQKNQVPFHLM